MPPALSVFCRISGNFRRNNLKFSDFGEKWAFWGFWVFLCLIFLCNELCVYLHIGVGNYTGTQKVAHLIHTLDKGPRGAIRVSNKNLIFQENVHLNIYDI